MYTINVQKEKKSCMILDGVEMYTFWVSFTGPEGHHYQIVMGEMVWNKMRNRLDGEILYTEIDEF